MIFRYFFLVLSLTTAPIFSAAEQVLGKPQEPTKKKNVLALLGQAVMWELEGKTMLSPDGKPVTSQSLREQYEALCAAEKKKAENQKSE